MLAEVDDRNVVLCQISDATSSGDVVFGQAPNQGKACESAVSGSRHGEGRIRGKRERDTQRIAERQTERETETETETET